ncbi:PIN domain nuclease [Endozoicomonas sp. SM1973]|uniref:PIN domain nuclease n=1 Tax=Spartinivicinus marinus TaxID=2994442 RepID=A0A853IAB5_9GAMM|nr:PIN domain nuclease [Spartinivicinus marinus]NYZ64376.1 PIN domain nuclease [Spartinivicinus marinus]
MVLVDTSVWIDYFNGKETAHTDRLDSLLSTDIVVIGDLILAEILQGFREDKSFKKAKELLTTLDVCSICSPELAIKSAQNYRVLRKKGITVRKTIDCIIATYCIENSIPLLYSDKDFEGFKSHLKLKPAIQLPN